MASEAEVDRLLKEIDRARKATRYREGPIDRLVRKDLARLKAKAPVPGSGPARSVQVGPGERAVRSGDPTSPATTTGHGPQAFPAPRQMVEALTLLNTTALRIGRRYQRDPGQMAEELAKRANELVGRVPMSFESALAQVARELESDLAGGRA
jgi:hypothetical protein